MVSTIKTFSIQDAAKIRIKFSEENKKIQSKISLNPILKSIKGKKRRKTYKRNKATLQTSKNTKNHNMRNKSERRRIYYWSIRAIPLPFKGPKAKTKMLFAFRRMFTSYAMGMESMEKKLLISSPKHSTFTLFSSSKIPQSPKTKS